jgi:hypothetical protein
MKKLIAVLIVIFGFPFVIAQAQTPESGLSHWQEVKVVYDNSEVADMVKGEEMSKTINTSLNFGTKSKFRKNCLDQLKKEAAEKGYSVILINEKDSEEKRFNKRGIEITLVGTGYKS